MKQKRRCIAEYTAQDEGKRRKDKYEEQSKDEDVDEDADAVDDDVPRVTAGQ